jgi:hypothetical protein
VSFQFATARKIASLIKAAPPCLCRTAGTLTYWIKQNAYLAKILETKPTTFNEIKQAVSSILEFSTTSALSKKEEISNPYFKIKSKRLKKKNGRLIFLK